MKLPYFTGKYHQLYRKILFTFVLSIVIIILILTCILQLTFKNTAISQINTFVKNNLSSISYSATFMSDSAKLLAMQIYNDTAIKKLLYDYETEPDTVNIALTRLKSYRNYAPFIQSIYIYNGASGKLYYDAENNFSYIDDFLDKDIFNIIVDKQMSMPLVPIPRRIKKYSSTSSDIYENVYTYVLYDTPYQHTIKDNFIVINVYEDWMIKTIHSLDSSQLGNIFIMNGKGQMVSSTKNSSILADISNQNYVQEILRNNNSSGYFIDTVDGVKSLITYVSSNDKRFDWKYLCLIPYGNITKSLDILNRNILIIGGSIILLGFLVSFFSSIKLYQPIDKIIKNLKTLEGERRTSLNIIKQEYLRNIIKTGLPETPKAMDFDIDINSSDQLSMIVLMIDCHSDFCSKYNFSDRNLFKFAIMNIAKELTSKHFNNECVDMENDHIVILLNLPENSVEKYEKTIAEIVTSIQATVKNYLKISLSIIAHLVPGTVKNIEILYSQALDSASYRLLYGHGCVIYTNKIKSLKSGDYVYPQQAEKNLINSLMLRKTDEARKLLDEIIKSTLEYSFVNLNLVILRLALAINSAMDNMKKSGGISIVYNYNEFISKLNKLETMDEINLHFYELFDYIISRLEGRKSIDHNYLVNSIIENINRDYKDQCLSIETLASTANMSSEYLGRLFKSIKSKSVAEYINEVRIEKAKELLASTDKLISEITVDTGFPSNNYFYTVFRKLNGITPTEYRQRIRNGSTDIM